MTKPKIDIDKLEDDFIRKYLKTYDISAVDLIKHLMHAFSYERSYLKDNHPQILQTIKHGVDEMSLRVEKSPDSCTLSDHLMSTAHIVTHHFNGRLFEMLSEHIKSQSAQP